MEVLPTILMEAAATHTEAHRVCMDTMVAMDMVGMAMARGLLMLSLDMATDADMELLQSMCPRLTMDMAITLPVTLMASILDMARGLLMPSLDMVEPPTIHMEVAATLTEPPKVLVDTMAVMDMDTVMARGLLMPAMAMVMLPATLTEAPRVFMDTMVVMDMDMVMARGLLMLDTMAVPALMSTRPVLTTMDLMAMVSTTMARGLLMLAMVMEVMAMDMVMSMELEATSK